MILTLDPAVFPSHIIVAIDRTDEELMKELDSYMYLERDCQEVLNLPGETRGRCVMLNGGLVVIRLNTQEDPAEFDSIIAHEAVHAAVFILHRMGVKLQVETSDEVYAYLVGWIVREIQKGIRNGQE